MIRHRPAPVRRRGDASGWTILPLWFWQTCPAAHKAKKYWHIV